MTYMNSQVHDEDITRKGGFETVTIVLNYNRSWDTIACVRSVLKSSLGGNQIVMMDNGSEIDDFAALTIEFGDTVLMLRSEANLGVAAAWNAVIVRYLESHDPKYLFLLNNDTVIDASVIRELLRFMDETETAGAASPSIMTFDSPHALQYGHHVGITEPTVDYQLSGCALMVRVVALEDVGMFDEDFFMYSEETDFLHRMRRTKWKAYYVPTNGKVYHKGAATSSLISGFEAYHRARNELVFAAKNLFGMELLSFLSRYFFRSEPGRIIEDISRPGGGNVVYRRIAGMMSGIVRFPMMRSCRTVSQKPVEISGVFRKRLI